MSEYITFNSTEQFTFNEFDAFLDSNPLKMAEMLSEKIIQRLIVNHEKLYLYGNDTKSYKVVNTTHSSALEYLLMIVRKFVVNSHEALSDNQKQLINRMYKDVAGAKCNRLFYRDFILDIYHLICYTNIVFDYHPNQVHYRNGYVDLTTLKFKPRNPCVEYVTKFIDHDFVVDKTVEDDPFESDDECDDSEEKEDDVPPQFSTAEFKRVASLI